MIYFQSEIMLEMLELVRFVLIDSPFKQHLGHYQKIFSISFSLSFIICCWVQASRSYFVISWRLYAASWASWVVFFKSAAINYYPVLMSFSRINCCSFPSYRTQSSNIYLISSLVFFVFLRSSMALVFDSIVQREDGSLTIYYSRSLASFSFRCSICCRQYSWFQRCASFLLSRSRSFYSLNSRI